MSNDKEIKETDTLLDDDIEIIDINPISANDNDENDEESGGFRISFHLIFAILVLILIGFILFFIFRWNSKSATVDTTDILPDEFDMENMDYYIYPDPEIMASHPDDGENNILLIGNGILTQKANGRSLIDALKEKLDANIYYIATDSSKIASDTTREEGPSSVYDSFSLYRSVKAFTDNDYNNLFKSIVGYPDELFFVDSDERAADLLNQFQIIDPVKIDTVIIMYSLADYYGLVPTLTLDEEQINSYYGALYTSVKMIQDKYPHINIVISSPTQSYLSDENGNIVYADRKDYGFGNSSAYIDMMYFVATKCCVSYIDNYFYGITDENITEYVEKTYLTEKGISLVSSHIVNFLTHPESVARIQ